MSVRWETGSLLAGLRDVLAKSENLDDDVAAGARVVLEESETLVPKIGGQLAGTGKVDTARGGTNTVAIIYTSVYAHWIHEHLFFKHPHGGQAKFLETAMIVKGGEAVNTAGDHFWGRL